MWITHACAWYQAPPPALQLVASGAECPILFSYRGRFNHPPGPNTGSPLIAASRTATSMSVPRQRTVTTTCGPFAA